MVEYEACAMGIPMAIEHQISKLKVFGDSTLVIYQLYGEWETRDAKLVPYHAHIMTLSILTKSPLTMSHEMKINWLTLWQPLEEAEIDGKPWYHDIREYLKKGVYPLEAIEIDKRMLRRLATGFFLSGVILYKRSTDSTLLV
ncbi:hypothetical protein CR513_12153, partial [Mucuna pruriens]